MPLCLCQECVVKHLNFLECPTTWLSCCRTELRVFVLINFLAEKKLQYHPVVFELQFSLECLFFEVRSAKSSFRRLNPDRRASALNAFNTKLREEQGKI